MNKEGSPRGRAVRWQISIPIPDSMKKASVPVRAPALPSAPFIEYYTVRARGKDLPTNLWAVSTPDDHGLQTFVRKNPDYEIVKVSVAPWTLGPGPAKA